MAASADSDSEISFNPRRSSSSGSNGLLSATSSGRKRARKAKRRLSAALADAIVDSSSSWPSTASLPSSPTKVKRLRLILGKETVSTVNYSD
jgi:hypothetical protein